MADIEKALARMDEVVISWFGRDQMLLHTWTLMEKIADPAQKTMGIDTRGYQPIIRFNPNFVNALSQEVLEHIMANVCVKILLRHPTSRIKDPAEISGLASDVTVNQMGMKDLPNIDNIKELISLPGDFSLEVDQFYEAYFRDMMDDLERTSDKIKQKYGKRDPEPTAPPIPSAPSSGDTPEEGDETEGSGSESSEESSAEEKPGDGFQEFKNQRDAIKEMMDPRSSTNQHWADNSMFDSEIRNLVNENKGNSRMWGSITGSIVAQIVAANTPKISWREILRRFNTSIQTMKSIPSRKKANRRFDLDAPGRKRINITKVIFAVDCSGSMSDEDLKEGFAVINAVCKHAVIEYVLFDTEIKMIEKKVTRAKETFKISGRGGTDFELVCRYADSVKADGLVIYTDGFAPAPIPPKNTKVLWLLTGKDNKPPVTWGYSAHLDRAA